jgi:hypothetical protein
MYNFVIFVATLKGMTSNFFYPSLLLLFLDPGSEIRDPGSGIRDPRSEIRDPGWVKIRIGIRDKHPGSATLIPGHISESLETIFWVKILKFFDADADPDMGIFLTLYPGWKKFGSPINISDPQHGIFRSLQKSYRQNPKVLNVVSIERLKA